MAESNNEFGSGSKIKPYQLEPVHATGYGAVVSQKPQVNAWERQIGASA